MGVADDHVHHAMRRNGGFPGKGVIDPTWRSVFFNEQVFGPGGKPSGGPCHRCVRCDLTGLAGWFKRWGAPLGMAAYIGSHPGNRCCPIESGAGESPGRYGIRLNGRRYRASHALQSVARSFCHVCDRPIGPGLIDLDLSVRKRHRRSRQRYDGSFARARRFLFPPLPVNTFIEIAFGHQLRRLARPCGHLPL